MQVFRAQSGIMVRSEALWARDLGFNPDTTPLISFVILSRPAYYRLVSLSLSVKSRNTYFPGSWIKSRDTYSSTLSHCEYRKQAVSN